MNHFEKREEDYKKEHYFVHGGETQHQEEHHHKPDFLKKEPSHPHHFVKKENNRPKPKKSFPKHNLLLFLAIIQIALLVFIAYHVYDYDSTTTKEDKVTGKTVVQPDYNLKKLMDDDAIKGDKNAKVTIIEFSDYECPYCARFYQQTYLQIKKDYIDTGKVNFVYRDFPLSFHQNAQKAAEAAECAGEQNKYYKMYDLLFEKGVSSGVSAFKQYAQSLNLNMANFNSCLDSGKMTAEVKKDMQDGAAAGIKGTPGFIINGKVISGAQPYSVFKQELDALLS